MTSINVKLNLIRLDMVIKDIHRIWSEVPSSYLYPKSLLAQSRAYVRSDVKKSLSLAGKARKLFQRESILATRYNLVADTIEISGDVARSERNNYLKCIIDGDYVGADASLNRISEQVSRSRGIGAHVSARLTSSDDGGCVFVLDNNGPYTIMVTSLIVTKGSDRVKTVPQATFSIQPNSVREILVPASPEIMVSAEYVEHGETKTIQVSL